MQKLFASLVLAAAAQALQINVEQDDYVAPNVGTPSEVPEAAKAAEDVTVDAAAQAADLDTDPVCSLGGDRNKADHKWPSTHCCRVYEDVNWQGKYMDFCTKNDKKAEYELLNQWGRNNWEKEISSWKCGANVMVKLCHDMDNCDNDDGPGGGEHGGPYSFNKTIGKNDSVQKVVVIPTEDSPGCTSSGKKCSPLTVYDQPKCTGKSTILEYEDGKNSSGSHYSSYTNIAQWPQGSVASMLQPSGTDVEWFFTEQFRSNSFTFKNFGAYTCRESADLPGTRSEQTQGDYSYGDYGTRAVQYREKVFPRKA